MHNRPLAIQAEARLEMALIVLIRAANDVPARVLLVHTSGDEWVGGQTRQGGWGWRCCWYPGFECNGLALSLNLSLAATFEEYQMKRRHSVHEVVRVPT